MPARWRNDQKTICLNIQPGAKRVMAANDNEWWRFKIVLKLRGHSQPLP
jgi:hypothetical protein